MVKEWRSPHISTLTPDLKVRRSLPFKGGKGVGPFVFLDHMGPHEAKAGEKFDVGPHPHIGLSTLTYLFEGESEHRDSLGTVQRIKPLDVNWMTAGSGIVHSERTPKELIDVKRRIHGLQAWVALPKGQEDINPSFEHHAASDLPVVTIDKTKYRVILGEALGFRSPVTTFLQCFYVHAELDKTAELNLSFGQQEVAFYLIHGKIEADGMTYDEPGLLIFETGSEINFKSLEKSQGIFLGGESLPEHRIIWWNFVSTDRKTIEKAKENWKNQTYPKIMGETEYIPLPG